MSEKPEYNGYVAEPLAVTTGSGAFVFMEPGGPGAPTNEQAAHALHWAYAAWFKRDLSLLHPFDRDVIQKVAAWTVGRG